jgi:hypothetical protein
MSEERFTDSKRLADDEQELEQLEDLARGIESANHQGFGDAIRRTRLESEIEALNVRTIRDRERLANDKS